MEDVRTKAKDQGYEPCDPNFPSYLDSVDPLKSYREKYHIPKHPRNPDQESIYFCGNSLGPQPKGCRDRIEQVLKTWENEAVEGWHTTWLNKLDKECVRIMSHIVGAKVAEVGIMNTLTLNIHQMLTHFYNPTSTRYKMIVEKSGFPSDLIAVKNHLNLRGQDPKKAVLYADTEDETVYSLLEKYGDEVALVWLEGVHYLVGSLRNMKKITQVGHSKGALVGFDLAHGAGNVPLSLHDWNVDFAVWCTYKYLCSGPGGIGALFVHERQFGTNGARLGGWWSQGPHRMFLMDPDNPPMLGAEGFHTSTQSQFQIASLSSGLEIYDQVGMNKFRAKSKLLTGYCQLLLETKLKDKVKILTPNDPESRGCQLTLTFETKGSKKVLDLLKDNGVIGDFREPNYLRISPNPLFNKFQEVYDFVKVLETLLNPKEN